MSLLDDWNREQEAHSRSAAGFASSSSTSSASGPSTVAAPAPAPVKEKPIFQLLKIQWSPKWEQQGQLVDMDAANDVLLMATSNGFVFRWSLEQDNLEEILITTKKEEKIHRVLLDPRGEFALVSMRSGSVFLLPPKKDRPVLLTKLKGPVLQSAAWYTVPGERLLRILLGTTRGQIFELVLEDGKEKSAKRIFELASSDPAEPQREPVISGVRIEQVPGSVPGNPRFYCLVATPVRHYQFVGGPTAEAMFARYGQNLAFVELPGNLGYSELRFFAPPAPAGAGAGAGAASASSSSSSASSASATGSGANAWAVGFSGRATPQSFAWLTGAGIYYSPIGFPSDRPVERLVVDGKLFEHPFYPDEEAMHQMQLAGQGVGDGGKVRLNPIALALTQFHFVLLFRNRFVAINAHSKEIVADVAFSPATTGAMRGLCVDEARETIWVYTDRTLFEVAVEAEHRDMWRYYLQERKFDLARQFATNPVQQEQVLNEQGDYLFQQKQYQLAAEAYAKTNRTFEEITLRFVQPHARLPAALAMTAAGAGAQQSFSALVGLGTYAAGSGAGAGAGAGGAGALASGESRAALKTYLRSKLRLLRAEDLTQLTMLCTWLTEIFLHSINVLSEPLDAPASASGTTAAAAPSGPGARNVHAASEAEERKLRDREDREAELEAEVAEFRDFLEEYSDCLPRETTLELISSHGRARELLQYARLINDTQFVLDHFVQHRQMADAVALLAEAAPAAARAETAELFYRFVPQLLPALPRATVDVLLEATALDPTKLIPAFLRCGIAVPKDILPADAAFAVPPATATAGAGASTSAATVAECENQVIRYLNTVIDRGDQTPVIHNLLFSLLASQPAEEPLLAFLRDSAPAPLFDPKFALRVCRQAGPARARASIELCRQQGLVREAVQLALDLDVELAKALLADPQTTGRLAQETVQELWTLVAKQILRAHPDPVRTALALLHHRDCPLKLEQLLPCLPDFVRIGEFKGEVLATLSEYNRVIDELKQDMDALTSSAAQIRQDIHQLGGRSGVLTASHRCDLCSQPVLLRSFLYFPCTHAFHSDCMLKHTQEYFAADPERRRRALRTLLEDPDSESKLRRALVQQQQQQGGGSGAFSSTTLALSLTPAQDRELEEEFAQCQCALCGDIMIDSVLEPFVLPNDPTGEAASWKI